MRVSRLSWRFSTVFEAFRARASGVFWQQLKREVLLSSPVGLQVLVFPLMSQPPFKQKLLFCVNDVQFLPKARLQSGFHLLQQEDRAELGLCQAEDRAAPLTLNNSTVKKTKKLPTNLMTLIISKATNLLCSFPPPVHLPLPPPPPPRQTCWNLFQVRSFELFHSSSCLAVYGDSFVPKIEGKERVLLHSVTVWVSIADFHIHNNLNLFNLFITHLF